MGIATWCCGWVLRFGGADGCYAAGTGPAESSGLGDERSSDAGLRAQASLLDALALGLALLGLAPLGLGSTLAGALPQGPGDELPGEADSLAGPLDSGLAPGGTPVDGVVPAVVDGESDISIGVEVAAEVDGGVDVASGSGDGVGCDCSAECAGLGTPAGHLPVFPSTRTVVVVLHADPAEAMPATASTAEAMTVTSPAPTRRLRLWRRFPKVNTVRCNVDPFHLISRNVANNGWNSALEGALARTSDTEPFIATTRSRTNTTGLIRPSEKRT
jgi:hypothetical protein